MIRLSLLAVLMAFSLSACDIVEGDKICTECLVEGAGKKVIIEDFTGHQCGNCPRAHEKLDELEALYGEDLIIVSIHAGGFASLFPALGYTADYTTQIGNDLEAYYNADIEGLPIGMVNRRRWDDGNVLQKFGSWGTQIGVILGETPQMGIEMTAALSESGEQIEVAVEVEYYAAADANHNVVVILTEDSIVSKQSDYDLSTGYVAEYEHKHMLRASITQGSWGVPVKGGPIFAGETISKNFALQLDPAWDPSHFHVVAYVMDNVTKEILQAEEIKL